MVDICHYCQAKSKATGKLDHKQLEKLGHSCNQTIFQKDDIIMIQDALSSTIVYIQEGLVKVHAIGPEKEQILKIVKGPSYLGLPTTIGAKFNKYSATAISETSACFIGLDVFKGFIINSGEFAYEIIVDLCKSELQHYKKCINQVQKQSAGKIAEALLYFSEEIFNNTEFKIPLSRNELGDLTCSTRETVSRVLSDFSSNNIIKINKNDISILNKKQLEYLSKMG